MVTQNAPQWLVIPAEMNVIGTSTGPGRNRPIATLLCVELDAETAAAAGWVHPVSPREQVAARFPLTFERHYGEASA